MAAGFSLSGPFFIPLAFNKGLLLRLLLLMPYGRSSWIVKHLRLPPAHSNAMAGRIFLAQLIEKYVASSKEYVATIRRCGGIRRRLGGLAGGPCVEVKQRHDGRIHGCGVMS